MINEVILILDVCFAWPHIRQDEREIKVDVIPDSPTQIILVSPEKAELLANVKQALQDMEQTTIEPIHASTSTVQVPAAPENTKRTRRPPKEKPKKDRPLLNYYLDTLTSTLPPPPPSPSTANPNFGTYITNIENLQIALTGMASDIDTMCDDTNKSPSSLDPLRNPFIQFLQNVTQQQANLTNTVLQYWATAPGLTLQPLTLQPIKPLIRSMSRENTETFEIDEKLKGLENAIKNTIEEMLPHMRYIEQFPSDSASPDEWEKFNDSIEYVAARLRNKTIQQVLDKEKTKNLLENYDKYLSAVQVVRLYRDMENGKDTSDAIKDTLKSRKGC